MRMLLKMRMMRCMQRSRIMTFGFSLIEVNMAVFVMAVGIIGMAALYPLGLRESIQSTADLKQSIFADVVLGAAVAAASSTNMTWATFKSVALSTGNSALDSTAGVAPPAEIQTAVEQVLSVFNNGAKVMMVRDKNFQFYCFRIQRWAGDSNSPIMGFVVTSIEMDTSSMSLDDLKRLLGNQQIYYAEALFQGVM